LERLQDLGACSGCHLFSSFLALTAVPLSVLKGLRHFFEEPDLWDVLSEVDKIGTVVIFTMFWIAIIVRLWAEIIRKPRGRGAAEWTSWTSS
jgi:hypothetical protein